MLIETSHCPFCGNGHKTPCFARYSDGYKCYSCGAYKRSDRRFIPKDKPMHWNIELPELCPSMGLSGLQYLYQYYVTDAVIRKYRIVQAFDGSLIFPVSINNEVVFYVRRWLHRKIVKNVGNIVRPIFGEGETLVIVEDFISAIRVAETTSCLCLFGTKCDYKTIHKIISQYNQIVIWLDGDKAGQTSASNLRLQLRKQIKHTRNTRRFDDKDIKITNLCTKKDPKCYSNEEIRMLLCRWMNSLL